MIVIVIIIVIVIVSNNIINFNFVIIIIIIIIIIFIIIYIFFIKADNLKSKILPLPSKNIVCDLEESQLVTCLKENKVDLNSCSAVSLAYTSCVRNIISKQK